jgi:ABC-type polysaccharide/polyol phosphate transport system ATPase subunit
MVMRLGFAVATEVEPDILIIDEVLAVGDESFQEKCLARMAEFRAKGTTILFVSHALDSVQAICERAIWIEGGLLRQTGTVDDVIDAYHTYVAHPTPTP